MRAETAYDELIQRVREETLLTSCEALLEWDEETYMPPGGVQNRSEQLALLAGLLMAGAGAMRSLKSGGGAQRKPPATF